MTGQPTDSLPASKLVTVTVAKLSLQIGWNWRPPAGASDIEIPALVRRMLDYDSTSVLKGMLREALSIIFETLPAVSVSPRRPLETLSLDP